MFLWRSEIEEQAVIFEDAINNVIKIFEYVGDDVAGLKQELHSKTEIAGIEQRVKALHILYRRLKREQQKAFNGTYIRKTFMGDNRGNKAVLL